MSQSQFPLQNSFHKNEFTKEPKEIRQYLSDMKHLFWQSNINQEKETYQKNTCFIVAHISLAEV